MMITLGEDFPYLECHSDETIYLFIDGGQVNDIAKTLYQIPGELDLEPIYMLPPFEELKDVSPYVIKATQDVQDWFKSTNEVTAGFFFSTTFLLDEVCDYYRQFIRVISPYRSKVFLKMAHSEVAWTLLSKAEHPFWGPISHAWIPTRMGWKELVRDKYTMLPNINEFTERYVISDGIWDSFAEISWRNTMENLERHVRKWFPHLLTENNDFNDWLNLWAKSAYRKGFTTERDLFYFFNVIGLVGDIDSLPNKYPDIDALIHQASELTPSQRIEQAAKLAYQYSKEQRQG
ncbi:DUF4123 domain-containing protein [Vibrio sp.]|nr:DUF4123 domain-containing protein [Vibrio sp.]